MIITAIAVCEIGFWVVLAAGLLSRYALGRRRLGAVLLASVPVVDLLLLAFTVLDLRHGATPRFAHGLAAVYLGFSVAFGPSLVRWADVRVAFRWAAGPPPAPTPRSGTPARMRHEWREFAKACGAVGLSALLLLAAIALVGEQADPAALAAWLPRLGLVLLIWLGWPVWESARTRLARSAPGAG